VRVKYSVATIVGGKINNEDCFCINDKVGPIDTKEYYSEGVLEIADDMINVIAVFDGVTSSFHGERAANIVANTVKRAYEQFYFTNICKENFDKLMEVAAANIRWEFNKYCLGTSSATTISLVAFNRSTIWSYNLGDSPIYLYRNNQLMPLFREHTVGAEKMLEYKQKNFLYKIFNLRKPNGYEYNCLTKCISTNMYKADGYLTEMDFLDNDTILICSDGLLKAVEQKDITNIIAKGETATRLTQMANMNIALDNVTAILIRKE